MTSNGPTINGGKEEMTADAVVTGDAEIVPINLNPSSFDYQSLDVAVATEMQSAACRIRQRTRAAYIDVGRDLIAIRDTIEHGKFIAWVEGECEINIRTAQRMMAVAEFLGKNNKLSYLPPGAVLPLTARTTPPLVIKGILKRIEAGERPSASEITGEVIKAKNQEADLARRLRRRGGKLYHAMTAEKRALAEAAKERHKKRLQREEQKRKREQAKRLADAEAAANLLVDCIGERLHEFIELVEKATWWDFKTRLMARHILAKSTETGDLADDARVA